MDISSASDQLSSVRRRPLSLKAAPSTSLEAESDNNAVLLRREISRKFAAHLPAPRRERKKSVIIPFPAANVVSSSIIFLLLFLHFLASVSDASRLSIGRFSRSQQRSIGSPRGSNSLSPVSRSNSNSNFEDGERRSRAQQRSTTPTNRTPFTSPRRSSTSPVPRSSFTYNFTNGDPAVYLLGRSFLISFCSAELDPPSWRIINPGQKRKRVSLYVGHQGEIKGYGAPESGLASLLREGFRASMDRFNVFRKNNTIPKEYDYAYFGSLTRRAERIPEGIDEIIRKCLQVSLTGNAEVFDVDQLDDVADPLFPHRVIFASSIRSYKVERGEKITTGAAAVLLIWDPLALPSFLDMENVGMVYVTPPDVAHFPTPESRKEAIRDSAKNVFTLLAHYRETRREQYDGIYVQKFQGNSGWKKRWTHGPFPSVQEYHAELIGDPKQFGLSKTEIARENLAGYLEANNNKRHFLSHMVTNLAFADGAFVKAALDEGIELKK